MIKIKPNLHLVGLHIRSDKFQVYIFEMMYTLTELAARYDEAFKIALEKLPPVEEWPLDDNIPVFIEFNQVKRASSENIVDIQLKYSVQLRFEFRKKTINGVIIGWEKV